MFTVESENSVLAESKVLLLSGAAAEILPVPADSKLLAGRFRDLLVLIDNQWLIDRREGSIELSYDFSR